MQPLPTISRACGGSGGERCVATKRSKQQKLAGFYDFPELSSSHGALRTVPSAEGGGQNRQTQARNMHPADEQVAEWMRHERRRAEERAEVHWRRKFKTWQQQQQCAPRRRSPSRSNSVPDISKATLQTHSENDIGKSAQSQQDLEHELRELSRSLAAAKEQLHDLKKGSSDYEQRFEDIKAERDAWRDKAMHLKKMFGETRQACQTVSAQLGQYNSVLLAAVESSHPSQSLDALSQRTAEAIPLN